MKKIIRYKDIKEDNKASSGNSYWFHFFFFFFFFHFFQCCASWVWTIWLASFKISPSSILATFTSKHLFCTCKNWLRLLSWVKQVPTWYRLYNLRELFNYFMSTRSMSETYKPQIHYLSKKTDTEVTTILYIRLEVNILFSSWYCLPIF